MTPAARAGFTPPVHRDAAPSRLPGRPALALILSLAGLLLLPALAAPARAEEDPWTACRRAIAAAEPRSGLPPGLLLAIALVESGRSDPRTGRFEPWPWSLNVEGEARRPESRAAAAAEVAALQDAGRRSIDIGCMQVNLLHHPGAFPDAQAGLEPAANVRYAIAFLRDLHARLGNWAEAIANYHSADAERGAGYHRRVVLARLGAAWAAGGGTIPVAAARGLCAPGMVPALRVSTRAARPRITCQRGALPTSHSPAGAKAWPRTPP
ncbi:transglycosylase SLT domain-containing protein [Paracraurococcus lichenis]|uniref:Transglycosylase SLT domain-containing protein n=1 Tax=Paracraurococcus lichenis TaxID=3064888 RepID=A0ABT9E247_9PROT|nr:transglycosylase SLT domain-containing protein [Paracraurococcus sp. LOR1-02]MDO9710241.1 transglycosylase SLT domain-containing protein [Paracraurococcus sp. LOR1-02]